VFGYVTVEGRDQVEVKEYRHHSERSPQVEVETVVAVLCPPVTQI
jgi:hypothetical protein